MRKFEGLIQHLPIVLKIDLMAAHNSSIQPSEPEKRIGDLFKLAESLCRYVGIVKLCLLRDLHGGPDYLNSLPWLQILSRPSFGDWVGAIRRLDRLLSDERDLGADHSDLARSFRLPEKVEDGDLREAMAKVIGIIGKKQVQKSEAVTLDKFFDPVVNLRNMSAHGSLDHSLAQVVVEPIQEALLILLETADVFGLDAEGKGEGWTLRYIKGTKVSTAGWHYESESLMGSDVMVKAPLATRIHQPLVENQVYLVRLRDWVVDTQINLFPFIHLLDGRTLQFAGMTDQGPRFSSAEARTDMLKDAFQQYKVLLPDRRPPPPPPGPPPAGPDSREQYREMVREALQDDGYIDEKERRFLNKTRDTQHLDEEEARRLEQEETAAYQVAHPPVAAVGNAGPPPGTMFGQVYAPEPLLPGALPAPVPAGAVPPPAEAASAAPELSHPKLEKPALEPMPAVEGWEGLKSRAGEDRVVSRLLFPRFSSSLCLVHAKAEGTMTQMKWPEAGQLFFELVQGEVERRTQDGWPAGFEPVGDIEVESYEGYTDLNVFSNRMGRSKHWYMVESYPIDGDKFICVAIAWCSESNKAIRDLEKMLGYSEFVLEDRLFVQYLIEKDTDGSPCTYTAFAVETGTLLDPEFVSLVAGIFLALIGKLTNLGMR